MSIAPILIAVLSTFSFSCLDASLGYLTNVLNIPITQIILLRTGAVCLLCLAYLAYTRPVDAPFGPAKVRHLIWMRAVMLTAGLFLGYSSLHYLTLAEYLTLYCLNPLFTAWACWMFAGEPVTRTQTVCCLISFLAITLVTDPFGRSEGPHLEGALHPALETRREDHLPTTFRSKLIGVSLCLPDVATTAAEMVIMRLIKDQASTVQILTILSLCPAATAGFVIAASGTSLVAPDYFLGWILLLGVVPLGLTAQYALTYASQRVSGTQVALVQYTGVVFGTLIQWIVYKNHPSVAAAIGMVVILVCGIYASVNGPDEDGKSIVDEAEYIALPTRPSEDIEEGPRPVIV